MSCAPILQDINLELHSGELVALVGPNGAGKSTLLQVLAGLKVPTQGQYWQGEQSTQAWREREFAQRLSYLPQLTSVAFALTVAEVVALGSRTQALTQTQRQTLVAQTLTLWQLDTLAQRDVRTLSGGEQQRVQLARSFVQLQAQSCGLWLLDEPFSALDLRHQAWCFKQMQAQCAQGKAVLWVVHDLNQARRLASRVLLLDKGKLVADGAPKVVLSAKQVSQVFLVDTVLDGEYLHWACG
jgi:iron complex transport system ATP-binding protein